MLLARSLYRETSVLLDTLVRVILLYRDLVQFKHGGLYEHTFPSLLSLSPSLLFALCFVFRFPHNRFQGGWADGTGLADDQQWK